MYKLEFTLKQHTPLIHFQHDQAGATLRATEVKPKLDFFIMKKLLQPIDPTIPDNKIRDRFREIALRKLPDGSDHKWKNWLVGNGDHPALDYKLTFIPKGVNIQSSIILNGNNKYESHYPLILANMGGSYKKEELRDLIHFEEIKGRILNYNSDLNAIIANSISSFCAIQNFGNRSSKGFGSFTVLDYQIGNEEKILIPWDANLFFPKSTFFLTVVTKNISDVFEVIDYYWKRLKSGINYSKFDSMTKKCSAATNPDLYQKSFLYKFLDGKIGYNFVWGKRKVKRDFFNSIIPNSTKDERFARAFLGLPDKYTYARTFEDCNPVIPRTKISTRIEISIEHKEKDESRKIDRIPSPIIFKPVKIEDNFRVYILLDESYRSYPILDVEFTLNIADFTLKYGKDDRNKELKIKVKAGTKISDIQSYVDMAVDYARISNVRNPVPDLNYFLSLPPSKSIKTPLEKIDLKELIDEYNSNELKLSFVPINFSGNEICSQNVSIDKI